MTAFFSSPSKSAKAKLAVALLAALVASALAGLAVAAAGKADFSVSASPASQTVTTGQAVKYGVTVSRVNGFTGNVTLSVSGLPGDTTASWPNGQPTITLSSSQSTSELTIQTGKSTPEGTYSLTITGTSGRMVRSTTVSLTVQDPPLPTTFEITGDLAGPLVLDAPAQPLNVTMRNPYNQPLTVSKFVVTLASTSKAACDHNGNFVITPVPWTSIVLEKNETRTLTAAEAPKVRWPNQPVAQDACAGATLNFTYSASGTTAK